MKQNIIIFIVTISASKIIINTDLPVNSEIIFINLNILKLTNNYILIDVKENGG